MRGLDLRPGLVVAASLLAVPAPALAANCDIDGVDAIKSARDHGFGFRVRTSNATRCERSQATILVAAPQGRDAVCNYVIFGGRNAMNGWRLYDVEISASEGTEVDTVRLNKGWLLQISAARAQTSRVIIRRLYARGADCRKWNEAFTGQ